MEYQDFYEGHRICVSTLRGETGWSWAYAVEDGPIVESSGTWNATESIVLKEAKRACPR